MSKFLKFLSTILIVISLFSCHIQKKKTKYIEQTYQELKKSFPEANIELLKDSIKIIFPNHIMFAVGDDKLIPEFQSKLTRFSEILTNYNKTNILITGYTDNSGYEEKNVKLSFDRANNVKSFLLEKKVNETRLYTWGLGEKNPISDNDSEEGRAKNRRVEFIILYNE